MGYDTQPLKTLDEKGRFLKEAADNKDIIFYNMIIIMNAVLSSILIKG